MNILENYLQYLDVDNRSKAKEWRGPNIPYGDYEPTDKQGTIPGNDFKETAVGEDLTDLIQESGNLGIDYMDTMNIVNNVGMGAALILIAHTLYKRLLSKAAKSCQGLSSGAKDVCIQKFKIHAIESEINFLKSRISQCKKEKKPEKCKNKVNQRIRLKSYSLEKAKKRYKKWYGDGGV